MPDDLEVEEWTLKCAEGIQCCLLPLHQYWENLDEGLALLTRTRFAQDLAVVVV